MSRDLLFEIGTEEIPSAHLYHAIAHLERVVPEALSEARLSYEAVRVLASPRRLAVLVDGLSKSQPDVEHELRGPSVAHAFDEEDGPTKAAEGFARSKGVAVEELERREADGGEYVFAVVHEAGKPAVQVLPDLLAGLAGGIDWPKSMRWGAGDSRFSRPVRWLVALFGDEVVPVRFAGLDADRVTRGHRFLSEGELTLSSAEPYAEALRDVRVVVDQSERAALIREGIERVAREHGVEAVVDQKVLAEVIDLVEWPTVALGSFDEEFLEVPREVLETAMGSHQRYFPVQREGGSLRASFIVVHNGAPELTDTIVAGHERVLRARLADAAFFFTEDTSRGLETYVPELDAIVFQERLGTVGARVGRVEALTRALAEQVAVPPDEAAWAARAAHLAKADLVTDMVVEFPTLQGVMGRHYALASGEASEVAQVIEEHYLPRHAGDELPETLAGALVSVADKLDTIVGIFAIDMAPTGSADPYALRRSALGILRIIIEREIRVGLDEAIAAALDGFEDVVPGLDRQETGRRIKEFVLGRMETVLKDRGHAYDTIAAVLPAAGDDPADAVARADALTAARGEAVIADLSVAYERAKNLADPALGAEVDPGAMEQDEERALLEALEDAESRVDAAMTDGDYVAALGVLAEMRGPVDSFFDEVLVMADDERLRENRLRLLNRFVELCSRFADFGRLTV